MIQSLKKLYQTPTYQLALGIVVLCITLQYTGLDSVLRYDRTAIEHGQWWLLLTGNFVHLGNGHLWMNMAGFALVVALVWPHYSAREWLLIILTSSLIVSIGLWLLNPEIQGYVGFSGTLHGLILAGCLADLRVYPKSATLLLTLILGKLTWEQFAGALPGSESTAGGPVVVDSHLYGAIGGVLVGTCLLLLSWQKKRKALEHSNS